MKYEPLLVRMAIIKYIQTLSKILNIKNAVKGAVR
jgi:hypothetical protein